MSSGVYTINSLSRLSNDNMLSKHYKKDSQRVSYPLASSKITFIVIIVKRIYKLFYRVVLLIYQSYFEHLLYCKNINNIVVFSQTFLVLLNYHIGINHFPKNL